MEFSGATLAIIPCVAQKEIAAVRVLCGLLGGLLYKWLDFSPLGAAVRDRSSGSGRRDAALRVLVKDVGFVPFRCGGAL